MALPGANIYLILNLNFPRKIAFPDRYREVVEMILKTGFDINVRTSRGTALHEAAICGKVGLLHTFHLHFLKVCL